MLFTPSTYIGIDPTAGHKPFVYAALDGELRLLALGQGHMDEVLAFAAGQRQAVAAVCAPRRPNMGLMLQQEIRLELNPAPRPGRWLNCRVAEYLLRQHNISIPATLAEAGDNPGWLQVGFALFNRLEALGYPARAEPGAQRQLVEVYPHACYTVLLGQVPLPKQSMEGRIQRQLILHDLKLKIPDPMMIFEEITRHRLLKGILPLDNLYTPEELDALVAAYTAWLAAMHPNQVLSLGNPEEGEIVLPTAEMRNKY